MPSVIMDAARGPVASISTLQLVLVGLVIVTAYLIYHYRDGRALGTSPRPDLVPFRQAKQTLFLGDFLTLLKEKDRLLDSFLERQRQDGHLLKEDPSRAFTITVPGMRMVLISKSEVGRSLPAYERPRACDRLCLLSGARQCPFLPARRD